MSYILYTKEEEAQDKKEAKEYLKAKRNGLSKADAIRTVFNIEVTS